MATLGVTFALAGVSMGGGKKSQQQGPPMNATSKEEEAFITYVFGAFRLFHSALSWSLGWVGWAGLTVVLCAVSS